MKRREKLGNVRTNRAIVHLLKQEGAMDAMQLASRLHLSAMAVRLHLYALQSQQLVSYAELTLSLLGSIGKAFGKAGLERLLTLRTRDQVAAYRERMTEARSLRQRLKALAAIRTDEGFMADVKPQPGGAFLLVENHCPICAAATACTGLCAKELEVFQSVLGDDIAITRTEHIVAGARRCAYRVCPAAADARSGR